MLLRGDTLGRGPSLWQPIALYVSLCGWEWGRLWWGVGVEFVCSIAGWWGVLSCMMSGEVDFVRPGSLSTSYSVQLERYCGWMVMAYYCFLLCSIGRDCNSICSEFYAIGLEVEIGKLVLNNERSKFANIVVSSMVPCFGSYL